MVCKKAAVGDYTRLADICYMCCVKQTTIDSPYSNLYGFTELTVRSLSCTIGFRTVEDGEVYDDQYGHCMAGHGFSPRDVNQRLFRSPEGKIISINARDH